jgi:hypothetical protein
MVSKAVDAACSTIRPPGARLGRGGAVRMARMAAPRLALPWLGLATPSHRPAAARPSRGDSSSDGDSGSGATSGSPPAVLPGASALEVKPPLVPASPPPPLKQRRVPHSTGDGAGGSAATEVLPPEAAATAAVAGSNATPWYGAVALAALACLICRWAAG